MSVSASFVIKQNDTEPPLEGRILDAHNRPIPLSVGDRVFFRMTSKDAGLADPVSGEAEIVDGPNGRATGDWTLRYRWQAGDTVTAGLYDAEVVIQFAAGGQRTIPSDDFFTVEVEQNALGQARVIDSIIATRH
jgi:hypothetical protein